MRRIILKIKFNIYPAHYGFAMFAAIRLAVIVAIFMTVWFLPISSFAQVGQWTWMHGSQNFGAPVNYGTQTVFAPTNNPAGLYEPCQWTDSSGKFWLFGGVDSYSLVNGDLWEYDPSINEWVWMNGSGTGDFPGNYGVQGVPSLSNIPPSRSNGMASWTDKQNNLWFFGGAAKNVSGSFNDMWEYNISSNEWTWMKGPDSTGNPGHYGTQGVPDTANNPPNRAECVATWIDSAGDLWLFGGQSYTAGIGVFNDLWRYNIATNTWTWMKGSNLPNRPAVYGTKAVESAANVPSARASYAHLKDSHENLWLFGGFNSTGTLLNDIWRYNPVTNNWVWLGGTKGGGGKAVYGTRCIADSNNIPGPRFENRACWTDKNGNLWFFGGIVTSIANYNVSNELWLYCIESNKWTFVSGDTIPDPIGNWGTMGVSSPTNKPDGRGGSVSWIDKSLADLYMFGGTTQGFPNSYGDLWRFKMDTTCGTCPEATLPVASFQASDTLICATNCINYTDHSVGATSWIWSFPGGTPSSSTAQNPTVCYDSSGTYDASLIATSYTGSGKLTLSNYIKVNAPPHYSSMLDTICPRQIVVLNPGVSPAKYLWSTGDTTQTITVSDSGYFTLNYKSDTATCYAVDSFLVSVRNLNQQQTDTSLCSGGQLMLDAGVAGLTYLWSTNASTQVITINDSGAYSVTIVGNNGKCDAVHQFNVVGTGPVKSQASDSICLGGALKLDAGQSGAVYHWSTNDSTQTITVHDTGAYSVTIISSGNCDKLNSYQVLGAVPSITQESDSICPGGELTLDAGAASLSYYWNNSSSSHVITVNDTGVYSVTILGVNGICGESRQYHVVEETCPLNFPNVITPNGDNLNDDWYNTEQTVFDVFDVKIWDRWGILIYQSSNSLFKWDGKNMDGKKVSDGVYYYIANAGIGTNHQERHGTITVIN